MCCHSRTQVSGLQIPRCPIVTTVRSSRVRWTTTAKDSRRARLAEVQAGVGRQQEGARSIGRRQCWVRIAGMPRLTRTKRGLAGVYSSTAPFGRSVRYRLRISARWCTVLSKRYGTCCFSLTDTTQSWECGPTWIELLPTHVAICKWVYQELADFCTVV